MIIHKLNITGQLEGLRMRPKANISLGVAANVQKCTLLRALAAAHSTAKYYESFFATLPQFGFISMSNCCMKPFLYLFHPYHRSYQITHHASLPFHGCSVFLIFSLEYSVCWSFCLLFFVSPISTKHWLSDASDSEVSVFYDTNSEALSFFRKKLNKTV